MRALERDTLVLGLAVAAGSLDAWSYFQLSHVFIANMTGNTILFGYSAAVADWPRARLTALAICFYVVGVFAGSLLARPIRKAVQQAPSSAIVWPARTSAILLLELTLVFTAATLAATVAPAPESSVAKLLVCLGAAAEGLQSAALNALKLPGIMTTYITGTWTTFTAGLAQLLDGETGVERRSEWELRLVMQAAVLAVYCGSAALIGWATRTGGRGAVGWVPAVALGSVVAGALFWSRSIAGS